MSPTGSAPGGTSATTPGAAPGVPPGRAGASSRQGGAWVGGAEASLRRRATELVLLGLLALAAMRYLIPGIDGRLDPDAGIYAYGGQQAAEGIPPYVSVLNRSGPLGHLVPGAAVLVGRWLGADDLAAMRLFYLALAVATVGLVYLLGVWSMRSRWAGLVAGAVMLSFHGFAAYASFGPREKTLLVFFLVATLAAGARGRWLLAGLGVAAATLTWQPIFVATFPAVVAIALLRRRGPGDAGRLAATLRILLGGLAPTALAVAAYAVVGQLRVALDAFLFINLNYTRQPALLDRWPRSVTNIWISESWPSLFVAAGLLVLVLLAGAALVRARGSWQLEPAEATLVGLGFATLGVLGWSLRAFQTWPDLFIMLPLGALGTAGLVPLAGRVPLPGARVTVASVLALTAAALSLQNALALRANDSLRGQQEFAAALNEAAGPDATVLSVAAPDVLVLLGKRNPTRFQSFGGGLKPYYRENLPGGLAGYRDRIRRIGPDLIVTKGTSVRPWQKKLFKDYQHVGRSSDYFWLAARALPAERRQAVRAALAEHGDKLQADRYLVEPTP